MQYVCLQQQYKGDTHSSIYQKKRNDVMYVVGYKLLLKWISIWFFVVHTLVSKHVQHTHTHTAPYSAPFLTNWIIIITIVGLRTCNATGLSTVMTTSLRIFFLMKSIYFYNKRQIFKCTKLCRKHKKYQLVDHNFLFPFNLSLRWCNKHKSLHIFLIIFFFLCNISLHHYITD